MYALGRSGNNVIWSCSLLNSGMEILMKTLTWYMIECMLLEDQEEMLSGLVLYLIQVWKS